MKNRILHTRAFIFAFTICLSITSQACYRTPRQLCRLADHINKHHGNPFPKQKALVAAFKQSISPSNRQFKPEVLQTIVTAVARNTNFKNLEKNKNTINIAIHELYEVPGFLGALARLLDSANSKNAANFTGTLGELQFAIEKKKQNKTILALGEKITAPNGRTLTEIDVITQDEDGTITWQEVKTRSKMRKYNPEIFNAQRKKQEELAKEAHVKYQMKIRDS